MQISKTMELLSDKSIKGEYLVIKIGNKVYSTTFNDNRTGKDFMVCREQLVDTKGIGIQKNIWIKGVMQETNNHNKLDEPLPFEINIYIGDDK